MESVGSEAFSVDSCRSADGGHGASMGELGKVGEPASTGAGGKRGSAGSGKAAAKPKRVLINYSCCEVTAGKGSANTTTTELKCSSEI